MGMFYGSLQHSYSGKRRKTNAWKKKKRHQLRSERNDVSTELRVPQHVLDRQAEAKAHREKYGRTVKEIIETAKRINISKERNYTIELLITMSGV